jgi:peptidyl-tRNA hydrolase, PTH1 family
MNSSASRAKPLFAGGKVPDSGGICSGFIGKIGLISQNITLFDLVQGRSTCRKSHQKVECLYMKLIAGIGNPDKEYLETRHNVGWMFLDWLQKKYKGSPFELEKKLMSEVSKIEIESIKGWLAKPQTYVNKSGEAIKKAKPWAKAKNEDIIVIQDDLDIPFGMCKFSFEKNSGGHRGIESVIAALKTTKFYRIRIGTGVRALDKARGQSDKKRDEFVRDFVLKKFTPSERDELKDIFKAAEIRLLQALKQG